MHAIPIYSDVLEREIRLERCLMWSGSPPPYAPKVVLREQANQWICGLGRSAVRALRLSRAH